MLTQVNLLENINVKANGSIFIDDDRSILISTSAFGILRRDLIKNMGYERMKGFLIRYGWELGQQDAKKVLKKSLNRIEDAFYYGPMLHKMKGHALIETTHLEVEPTDGKLSVHMEGTWEESYEAVEHLCKFGYSKMPVCFTLLGYASGYLSKICNQTVIFKEQSCQAEGHEKCKWTGKSLDYWNGEADNELRFYQESSIVKELETTYEELLEERDNLEKSSIVHEKLTEEVLQGNNLQSIAEAVYDATATPGVIVDNNHHPLAYTGLPTSKINELNEEFKTYLQYEQHSIRDENGQVFKPIQQAKQFNLESHIRLITPIFLNKKIMGYCSFIYLEEQSINLKIHKMILERIAMVSSLFLLNEKTKFEADRRIEGNFFEEVLRGECQSEEEIIRRGSFMQLDLSEPYSILTVKYQFRDTNIKRELKFQKELQDATFNYFKKKKENILVDHRTGSVIILAPQSSVKPEGIEHFCDQFLFSLSEAFPTALFTAGISKKSEQILKAKDCYNEALIAQRMATASNKVVLFDSLGVIGPLINQNNEHEIKKISRNILGSLLDRLDDKKMDLLKTLYSFLLNGGNLEQTAADIALSLSGLRYRLTKIEDLLDHDLRNPFYNYQLLLALQALVLIGELELNDM